MNKIIAFLVATAGMVACSSTAAPRGNDRPVTPAALASELVPQCMTVVRHNENAAAALSDLDYLDSMYCLGVMDGVTGINRLSHAHRPHNMLFCMDDPGFKTWHAAKVVVGFAEMNPQLLDLEQAEFVVRALANAYPCNER